MLLSHLFSRENAKEKRILIVVFFRMAFSVRYGSTGHIRSVRIGGCFHKPEAGLFLPEILSGSVLSGSADCCVALLYMGPVPRDFYIG